MRIGSELPWSARARVYALQIAQGVIDYDTALASLTALARISAGWNPDVSMDMIANILDQYIVQADELRARAESCIVYRVRPMVRAYAPPDAVFRAAEETNESHGRPLLSYEVRAVVHEEMSRQLAADRPQVRRRG